MANKCKIENLKKALDEAQNRSHTIADNVRILLQTNRKLFTMQLKMALDKGWTVWVTQTAEFHSYRADWENR